MKSITLLILISLTSTCFAQGLGESSTECPMMRDLRENNKKNINKPSLGMKRTKTRAM